VTTATFEENAARRGHTTQLYPTNRAGLDRRALAVRRKGLPESSRSWGGVLGTGQIVDHQPAATGRWEGDNDYIYTNRTRFPKDVTATAVADLPNPSPFKQGGPPLCQKRNLPERQWPAYLFTARHWRRQADHPFHGGISNPGKASGAILGRNWPKGGRAGDRRTSQGGMGRTPEPTANAAVETDGRRTLPL